MDIIEYLEHLEVLEATKISRIQRTFYQKIRLRSYLNQRVSPRERAPRQNKLRKESRGRNPQNQIILTKSSVLIVRVPMVGTGLIAQKTAILLRTWELKSPRKVAGPVSKDLRNLIP